ncbi:MAG: YopX family protein [Bacteroidia bacterium]|nr:YopX family protein [Bacteroidia bacterium]
MREIKFRGRQKGGEKKWLTGDLTKINGEYYIWPESEDSLDSPDNYEVDPETIGQLIGKKDQTGTKLFEGDILHPSSQGKPPHVFWEIQYSENEAAFLLMRNNSPDRVIKTEQLMMIGNIHDRIQEPAQ